VEILEKFTGTPAKTSDCCSTAADGSAVCIVPQNGVKADCACNTVSIQQIDVVQTDELPKQTVHNPVWGNIRGGLLFAIACITSPCCTPLLVPLVLWLFAGTPVAVWLGHNLGWVYGGLTLVSIASFVMLWRWLNKRNTSNYHV
jgi:hypothetical protein